MASGALVQYGCGLCAPSRWRNFDGSPTLRLQRIPVVGLVFGWGRVRFPENVEFGDVVAGLPVPSDSCRAVYCSHVLEHLSLEDFRLALRETHRILAPGGVFRAVLPDLAFHVETYRRDPSDTAAHTFMADTLLGEDKRARGIIGLLHAAWGNSRHRSMWDYKALARELSEAGFGDIRRATIGDDRVETFRDVEEPSRWCDSLGFQCIKPDTQ